MTLFSSDDLKQVFPEATTEGLTDPKAEIYSSYANAYIQSQESAGRIAIIGGRDDAIGEIINSGLINESNDSEKPFEAIIQDAFIDTKRLFEITTGNVPTNIDLLNEILESVDMELLEKNYKKFQELKLEPRVIFAPERMSLMYWEKLFKKLYTWQKYEKSDSVKDKLGNWLNYNILIANHTLYDQWKKYSPFNGLSWTVNIVSNCEIAPIDKLNYYGKASDYTDILSSKIKKYDFLIEDKTVTSIHPSVDTYFMQQALSIMKDGKVLDHSSNGYVWLRNGASVGDDFYALIAGFDDDINRINLDSVKVNSNEYHNIRPTYKAKQKEKG